MIAIIDYGAGNLRSIQRAMELVGAEVKITSDPQTIRESDRVILPGVGNAAAAMERLRQTGLANAISEVVATGVPLLGICLGMQLLFELQEEGPAIGLGFLSGEVKALPQTHKVPHMGWNLARFRDDSLLAGSTAASFYFVHSYIAYPTDPSDIAAETDYGVRFPSIVARNNIWGFQFHPEKSGEAGIALLRTWLDSPRR